MDVIFLFDFISPNAYLAHRVLPEIEARAQCTFVYKPILLGGLFKLAGNQSPSAAFGDIKNKLAYERLQTDRFVNKHKVTDFRHNPHFPISTVQILRGALAAERLGVLRAYSDRLFDDMWSRGLKLDEPDVVAASLAAAGLPQKEIMQLAQTPEIKTELIQNTDFAFGKGAFGAPSFLVGNELFFGKDSLGDMEAEVVRQRASQLA